MLRLRLEACTPRPTVLGELLIRNDGTGDAAIGHYQVSLVVEPHGPAREVRTARVEDYPRAQGAWGLVLCALRTLQQEETP